MTTTNVRPSSNTLDRLLYDRKTAAKLLSISVRAVDYMISNKAIETRRIGSRVLIPVGELHRLCECGQPEGLLT